MATLEPAVQEEIERLSEAGNEKAEGRDWSGALAAYRQALNLLPNPLDQWNESTWLLTAIGETLFFMENHEEARDTLRGALMCPGGPDSAFIHLRLGQVEFELQSIDRAKDELARAFMLGGDEVFEGEDPKYWTFIREILRPPDKEVGG